MPCGGDLQVRPVPSWGAGRAVDALGVSAMLARPVTIAAREPDADRQIRVPGRR